MLKYLYYVLGYGAVDLNEKLYTGMIDIGVSIRSADYLSMFTGLTLVSCVYIFLGCLVLIYGMLLIASYNRMIKLKNRKLRRKWSVLFLITLAAIIIEALIIF